VAPPAPKPPSGPPPSAGAEQSYVSATRAYYQTISKYPVAKEARLLKPQGSVVVRFTLTRTGEVRDVVVERSSGNQILDRQALSTVKSGRPPPFPEQAWASAPEHVFTVTLDYEPPA
jgi:protein TonB